MKFYLLLFLSYNFNNSMLPNLELNQKSRFLRYKVGALTENGSPCEGKIQNLKKMK